MSDLISRRVALEKLKRVVDEMSLIFADIREKNVDDSVCGLCEYDCDHGIDGYANECPGFERNDCFKLKEEYRKEWTDLSDIPSAESERNPGKWIEGEKTPGYDILLRVPRDNVSDLLLVLTHAISDVTDLDAIEISDEALRTKQMVGYLNDQIIKQK